MQVKTFHEDIVCNKMKERETSLKRIEYAETSQNNPKQPGTPKNNFKQTEPNKATSFVDDQWY